MSQLSLTPDIADQSTLSSAIDCLRAQRITLPTLSQLADPASLPQRQLDAMTDVDPHKPHAANLWRVQEALRMAGALGLAS